MNVHMVGIGGIGMSALAQLFHERGDKVTGSDRAHSPTTTLLASKGISVSVPHSALGVPNDLDLVVYSDAVSPTNEERQVAKERGCIERSYFEALGEVSKNLRTIAVSGTHGKTTTTAFLSRALIDAGMSPTAIVGSIVRDFGSNFVHGSSNTLVVEACEYRDHLLQLSPEVLVITNVEWDHTDWFKTEDDMVETFRVAATRVPRTGFVVTNPRAPRMNDVLKGVTATVVDYTKEGTPQLKLIGDFNIENAQAARAAARVAFPSASLRVIDTSLASFGGTWRRFEFRGISAKGALVYDDYAHHPTAVKRTLDAVREANPSKRLVVAFHPHLYSRTRDLMNDFASAFSAADRVFIAPIYAAREAPIPGVTSEVLVERIGQHETNASYCPSLDVVCDRLRDEDGSETILITMGAGDIYTVADMLVGSTIGA